jgi:hypothetical protein
VDFRKREPKYEKNSPGLYLKKVLKKEIEQIIATILENEFNEKEKIL